MGVPAVAASGAAGPKPAPARYATGNYGLTFSVPRGATYCPLPRNWVGSDHGTTLFLERPRRCGGAGFPSSSRGFAPETVARIDIYYGFSFGDDAPRLACHRVGTIAFLGGTRPICETREGGGVVRSVTGLYDSVGAEAEAVVTLVSRPERLSRDMVAFRALARSLWACNGGWRRPDGSLMGKGRPCPKGVRWF